MSACNHDNLVPVPEVGSDGLLTGGITVTCRDRKKVVYQDTTAKPVKK